MKIKVTTTSSDVPSPFVTQHGADVIGVLSGFDRLRLMATLRPLYQPSLMMRYLSRTGVLLKDFAAFAALWTERVRAAAHQLAEQSGRPLTYLHGSSQRKELLARDQARHDGLSVGLIGIWSVVEPCLTYFVRRDREQKQLVLRLEPGKCLHYYFYFLHEQLGLLHLRLQTWFPFAIHACINGRHWLASQLDQAGIGYVQRENCFTWLEDVAKAQALARAQLQSRWPTLLQPLVEQCHPHAAELCRPLALAYYWSVTESEYATDVMFKDASSLAGLYPALLDHAIRRLGCHDVLRFLGRRTTPRRFVGEASTSLLTREEGTRVKHWAEENSIKMYDKQGSVLRIETTINNVRRFKVRRMTVRKGVRRMRWIPMRFGLADLVRRVEVSRAANERYLQALAEVNVPTPVRPLLDGVGRRMVKENRAYRALRPVSREEAEVFQAVLDGRFLVRGFTNRDLRQALWPRPPDSQQQHRQSGQMTRLLRLLRAHGMIRKVSGTRYYRVTSQGHKTMSAALILREADVTKLAA